MLALAGTAIAATANASWWSRHGAHLVLLGVPTLLFAAIGIRADLQARTHRSPRVRDHAVRLACGFSIVAAAVHTAVCPEHFTEATVYGLFFLFAAIAQLAWAVIVWMAPRRGLLVAGAVGNGLVVALWALTRSVGIPIG